MPARNAPRARPRREGPKSRRTRAHVLEEALELASRAGFEGLTLGALAQQAGLSKSGLFAHFASKEDLQIRTLELASLRFVERVLKPAVARPRGVARVRELFDGWMRWIQSDARPRGDLLIACAFEFDDAPASAMRDAVVAGHHRMQATIERLARQAIDCGDFAAGLDPAQFAFEFLGIVHAHHHVHRLLGTDRRGRRARAAFERLLASCLAAPRKR